MAEDDFDPGIENYSESDSDDLKRKIAEQSLKAAEQVQDDPSRSSLHYGEDEQPETLGSFAPDGSLSGGAPLSVETPASEPALANAGNSDGGAAEAPETFGETAISGGEPVQSAAPARRSAGRARDDDLPGLDLPEADGTPQAPGPQEQSAPAEVSSAAQVPLAEQPQETGQAAEPNEAPTAVDLSNTALAENQAGAVVGRISVTDGNTGDAHRFEVSDDRFEVVDGLLKLKEGISLDHDDAGSLSIDVTAVDSGGASVTQSFEIAVADMPDVTHDTGFHAKYFDVDHRLRELDDIDWNADPTHEELVSDVNYQNSRNSFWEGGSKDTFGVEITGNIDVEEGGTFNFHIGGDDGVVLFVNGVEVIENDGLHSFRTRSGEIELEPGTHAIEIRYFENFGHAGLKLEWEGPGIDGRELVTAPSAEDLQTVSGMPLSLELKVEEGLAGTTHMIEGLPPGSTVGVGEQVMEVDASGAADVTGMDLSLVQITPPVDYIGDVAASLTSTVTQEDGSTATQTYPLEFEVHPADLTPPTIEVQTGFKASYFDVDHRLRELEQIDWDSTPTHEEVVGEVNYENSRESFWEGGSKDTFGARITGEITVEEGGAYEFFVGGDDGVVLFINGEEVVDNDGLHGFRTRTGEIELEPGTHEIEVRYFENYGHAGLKLEWEGPDTDGRELVRADTELVTEANGAIDIGLETVDLGDSGSATLSGLPADTILVSGEMTAVADGSDLSLDGWNLDLLEVMPPPGFAGEINAAVTVSVEGFNGAPQQASTSFQIIVEGDDLPQNGPDDPEHLMLMDQAEPNDPDDAGNADDVMQEAVVIGPEAEQSQEVAETYERQDW
ncbi:MAG: PA14 domain-containing protein [Pseudomonadota bacterium]